VWTYAIVDSSCLGIPLLLISDIQILIITHIPTYNTSPWRIFKKGKEKKEKEG